MITDWDHRIISIGFNGFPKGVTDDERLENRDIKYEMVVHGEINAILFAKQDLSGCTLYTWPCQSCSRCAGPVIQSGITRHVYPYVDIPRWKESFDIARSMFREADVELTEYVWEDLNDASRV